MVPFPCQAAEIPACIPSRMLGFSPQERRLGEVSQGKESFRVFPHSVLLVRRIPSGLLPAPPAGCTREDSPPWSPPVSGGWRRSGPEDGTDFCKSRNSGVRGKSNPVFRLRRHPILIFKESESGKPAETLLSEEGPDSDPMPLPRILRQRGSMGGTFLSDRQRASLPESRSFLRRPSSIPSFLFSGSMLRKSPPRCPAGQHPGTKTGASLRRIPSFFRCPDQDRPDLLLLLLFFRFCLLRAAATLRMKITFTIRKTAVPSNILSPPVMISLPENTGFLEWG